MFTTIINDCRDDNARARQTSRIGSLINTSLSFVGVDSDLEAGVQLIDILDATDGQEGLILVNVAPRNGKARNWKNGTPFAYFWYKKTLIISSIDGFALSAVKKLNLAKTVNIFDIDKVVETMLEADFLTEENAKGIARSQFRSFDFTPRAGVFMMKGNHLPSTILDLNDIPDLPPAIWNIDNFGNCKTTLTAITNPTHLIETRFGNLPYHEQLHSVPDDIASITKGSSGLGDVRFLELVIQGRNFAKNYNANIGDDIFTKQSHFRKATV